MECCQKGKSPYRPKPGSVHRSPSDVTRHPNPLFLRKRKRSQRKLIITAFLKLKITGLISSSARADVTTLVPISLLLS